MNDSFAAAKGRKVLSRASAEELGHVDHLVIDDTHREVATVVVTRGRKSMLARWEDFTGFGPDAAILADEAALHAPESERDVAAADGQRELVGKRALSETGNAIGTVDDVTFDPESGQVEALVISGRHIEPAALLGAGSYAAVLAAHVEHGSETDR